MRGLRQGGHAYKSGVNLSRAVLLRAIVPNEQLASTAFVTQLPILKWGRYKIRYIRSILSFLEGFENLRK
jgi:hypothetical protein